MDKERTPSAEGNGTHPTSVTPRKPWLKTYPADVDWTAPLKGVPLPALFEDTCVKFGSRVATNFLGKELTYAELAELVTLAATGMQKQGVGKGVNVGLLLPNTPTYVIFYYAILKAGGTVVNFNPLYSREELIQQAQDAQIHMLVTLDLRALFPKAEAMIEAQVAPHVVVCPFARLLPGVKSLAFRLLKRKEISPWRESTHIERLIDMDDLLDNDGRVAPVSIDPDNDIAVLQYTGGTTGLPKGAMLTHTNLSANVEQIGLWAPELVEGEERLMGILPFFHVFGMTVVMNFSVAKAATMILMPRFETKSALKLIRSTKPTIMPGVPTLYNALMHSPDLRKGDLASLKFCISGGAALPLEIKRGFEKIAGCHLVEGYGLSETSPVLTVNPVSGDPKEGSIGIPLPGTCLSIRSLEDPSREVTLGERGELAAAGPQIMKGYWQRPKETVEAMSGEFFRTGDVGYMDAEGFTFIVDRIKDIIISSGFNVYPRRIEEAIYEFPAVEEVTVLGIPDNYRGEAPKAYVKLHDGATATEDEIFKFLQPKLSKIEMPAAIEFRASLPKTLIGKLSKKELRAEIEKGAG